MQFFSVQCKGCGKTEMIEAPGEGAAELLWLEYKPCLCDEGVTVKPNDEPTYIAREE